MAFYNRLGNSGLKVSNICLGTMTFGPNPRPGNCSEELSHQILDRYVEMGGNFIDTADVYCHGETEKIVGTWLQKIGIKRDQMVIATKGRMLDGREGRINGACLSRKHLIMEVEESLKRLRTDYIDLYQFHCWDDHTPLEESLRTVDDLVKAGKIRYFGVSNFCGWQLQKLVDMSKYMGLTPCISLQQQYSLLNREVELDLTQVCQENGIGILPWSPLKGGWLTGKVNRYADSAPEGSRIHYSTIQNQGHMQSHPDWKVFANDEQVWSLLDKMQEMAAAKNKTVSQIALRWLIQKDGVSSVIIGCKTMKQLEDNLGASSGWRLTEEDMRALDELSQKPVPYPYNMINRVQKYSILEQQNK